MQETVNAVDAFGAVLSAGASFGESVEAPFVTYDVVCHDADGNEKWREVFRNVVTTAGKTDALDKYLKGSGYTAAWYLGLKAAGTAVVGDTMASHSGWTEITAYVASTRPAITWGTTSGGSNTASGVAFSINGTATVAGAFMVSDSTKSGTAGTLYSAGDFTGGSKSVSSGDTLTVTPTQSFS